MQRVCGCVCVCVCVCVSCSWRQQAHDHAQWCGMVNAAEDMNEQLEADEKASKDERKQRREEGGDVLVAQERWVCSEAGCGFLAQSKAGLGITLGKNTPLLPRAS